MSPVVRSVKDGTPSPPITPAMRLIGLGHSSYGHLSTRCPWTLEMSGSEALLPQTVIGEKHFLIDPGVVECTADIDRIGCEVREEDVMPTSATA